MRPMVVEIRRGILFYMYRADFTNGQWRDSFTGINRPLNEIREDWAILHPDYLVDFPEERGQRWEDA